MRQLIGNNINDVQNLEVQCENIAPFISLMIVFLILIITFFFLLLLDLQMNASQDTGSTLTIGFEIVNGI